MIQKESFLRPVDRTGVYWVKTFHLYKGFNRRASFVGNFIKISIRKLKPESFLKKKGKSIALIVKSKYHTTKLDGSKIKFYTNACILIKRKMVLRSKDVFGSADRKLRRKKLFFKFPGVL
jgi:large subunit ribosomal protein L14